jgi:hypothetical protein
MFSASKSSAPLAGGAITLTKSLRFRRSATAYLNRTPASASSQTTWTYSAWVKRGILDSTAYVAQNLFGVTNGTNDATWWLIMLEPYTTGINNNVIRIQSWNNVYIQSTPIYVDTSAWYHIVVSLDTTQATGSNRIKLYVNGVQVTSYTSTATLVQNSTPPINSAVQHQIGRDVTDSTYADWYMADVNFVDGQALTPSLFGATDATTGQWSPAKYTGTYGTNGFHLTFANTASTTTLGYDTSGNSNNWTTNNFSLTAGSTYDSMNDVPTLTSATAANYAVINPLLGNATKPTNGNLTWNRATLASYESILSTFGVKSGKWYIEFMPSSFDAAGIGITTLPTIFTTYPGGTSNLWWMYDNGASNIIWNQSSPNVATTRYASSQTWQIALDMDTGVCWIGINNTFYNSTNTGTGNPSTGSNPTFSSLPTSSPMFIFIQSYDTNWSANFGQQPFTYTPPTGFVALNTYNLPTPTIAQGGLYMNAVTYTGTTANQSISTVFPPDLVWIKSRSNVVDHQLFDRVRGANLSLQSNSTAAEGNYSSLPSFDSTGFTVSNSSGTRDGTNSNGYTYVAWNWKAGGTAVSNTSGSITSSVSANTTAGFSIVTYTGTGANATVGHGLGVAPSMIIVKNRTTSGTSWNVYHISTGNTGAMFLESTSAFSADSTRWNNTSPTSSVFTVGTGAGVNQSTNNLVAYCFAPIAGFSAFGSYTGNGSSSAGPFVYLGFRPKFIMFKNSSIGGDWDMLDTSRSLYNQMNSALQANGSYAEASNANYTVNYYSNGFQPLTTNTEMNGSGNTIIYMAFAENPFKYANAR